ncbi:hypothetical protein DFJ73DRAFT_921918 [Zopfochytrium polystomum]|nr:hypothetical protein DFJ73DRAFT_921918 [Zopfochytrium polystomum]
MTSTLASLLAAVVLFAATTGTVTNATPCGDPRDGLICMSSECKTGNGVWLKTTPLITGISLSNFDLQFQQGQPYALASSNGVAISVSLPDSLSGLYLSFTKASAAIGVGLPGGPVVGNLKVDGAPALGNSTSRLVSIDLKNVPFAPAAADQDTILNFEKVFQGITLQSGNVPLGMSGYATNSASISDGLLPGMDPTDVCLENIKFSVTSSLIGLGGLKDTTITSIPIMKGGSPSTGLELSVNVKIVNPSTITLKLNSDVTLALQSQGSNIGSVVLPNFSLGLGANTYTARGYLFPAASDAAAVSAASTLVAQFVAGTASPVVVASGKAANLPALDLALGSLSIPQTLPGSAGTPLLVNATGDLGTLGISPDGFSYLSFNSTILAENPFDVPVSIVNVSSTVSYIGHPCIFIDATFDEGVFLIPPKGRALSPQLFTRLPVTQTDPVCDSQVVIDFVNGPIVTDTVSVLTISVGGYRTTFKYVQNGLTSATSTPTGRSLAAAINDTAPSFPSSSSSFLYAAEPAAPRTGRFPTPLVPAWQIPQPSLMRLGANFYINSKYISYIIEGIPTSPLRNVPVPPRMVSTLKKTIVVRDISDLDDIHTRYFPSFVPLPTVCLYVERGYSTVKTVKAINQPPPAHKLERYLRVLVKPASVVSVTYGGLPNTCRVAIEQMVDADGNLPDLLIPLSVGEVGELLAIALESG